MPKIDKEVVLTIKDEFGNLVAMVRNDRASKKQIIYKVKEATLDGIEEILTDIIK